MGKVGFLVLKSFSLKCWLPSSNTAAILPKKLAEMQFFFLTISRLSRLGGSPPPPPLKLAV